ncbi:MAG: Bug family tripartite tricarboxylate transporter substrate binding protein [Lautropia sp.]
MSLRPSRALPTRNDPHPGASRPRTRRPRRRIGWLATAVLAIAAAPLVPQASHAQQWPVRPIRFVVPYPPGGNVDTAARIVAPGIQQALGQPVVVENRAGAGGMIAGEYVARSDADGYTFFFTANGPLLFSPLTFRKNPYQWDKDFEPVSSVSFTPLVLQVNAKLPVRTFDQLLRLVEREPDKVTMASPGAGTTNHLVSELLQARTGAKWTTVHYKGNAPATQDLLGGQVQFNFDQVSVALPYIQEGRLRPLAVTSPKRIASLPDVPTMIELGIADFSAQTFTGVVAPKGTPAAVRDRLYAVMSKVVADKDVVARFAKLGAQTEALKPDAFAAYLRKEYDTWAPVIRKINIQAN